MSNPKESVIVAYVRDVALRAAHTFWQSFSGSLAVVWASSGLDRTDLTSLSAWEKLALALAIAAAAALLSTLKSLGVNITGAASVDPVATRPLEPATSLLSAADLAGKHLAGEILAPPAPAVPEAVGTSTPVILSTVDQNAADEAAQGLAG